MRLTLILTGFCSTIMFSCTVKKHLISDLKENADHFHVAVSNIDASKDVYRKELSKYLDPNSNIDSLTEDYYNHWITNKSKTSYPLEVQIKKVHITKRSIAELEVHCLWYDQNYGNTLYITTSIWYRKQNRWYRSEIEERSISDSNID